jgi:hypothetical protein
MSRRCRERRVSLMRGSGCGVGETLVRKREALVEQRRGKGYSFRVKLENVKFAFDEETAPALELDPEMSAVERASALYCHREPSGGDPSRESSPVLRPVR